MQDLFTKALLAYVEVLELHLDSKTWYEPFHEKTEEMYETLFDIAHEIWERFVDLWGRLRTDDCMAQANRLVEILTTLKSDIESFEAPTKWTENLLSGHLDKLEFQIWNATWFVNKVKMNRNWMTNKDETLTDEVEVIIKD